MESTFAPLRTHLSNGGTLSPTRIIHGICIHNTNSSLARLVTFKDVTGTTTLFKLAVPANDSLAFDIHFLSNLGLEITITGTGDVSDTSVIIYHTHQGA